VLNLQLEQVLNFLEPLPIFAIVLNRSFERF